MSRREEAKDQRRQRIVDAARALIRSTEQTGFSMRQLAVEANVSLVTPYNLFGSKQAILVRLLDEDIGGFAQELALNTSDALDKVFDAVSLGKDWFARDEAYYRTVLGAVYTESGADYRAAFRTPRRALWRRLVIEAIDAGFLEETPHVDTLTAHLAGIYLINILEWVYGDIAIELMEARTHYGFALALMGHAKADYAERLRQRVRDSLAETGSLMSQTPANVQPINRERQAST